MLQFHPYCPGLVRHLLHRMGRAVPVIEVPHQADRLSLRRVANKIHLPQRLLAAVAIHVHSILSPKGFAGCGMPFAVPARIERPASDIPRSTRIWIDAAAATAF